MAEGPQQEKESIDLQRQYTNDYRNHMGRNVHEWFESIKHELTFTDKEKDNIKIQDINERLNMNIMSHRMTLPHPEGLSDVTVLQIKAFWGQQTHHNTLEKILEILRKNT